MVVQNIGETAAEFASSLEKISNDIINKNYKNLIIPPVVTCTSASDGRQTAMIQYFTKESKVKKTKRSESQSMQRITDFLIFLSAEIESRENRAPVDELTEQQYIINKAVFSMLKDVKENAIDILQPE